MIETIRTKEPQSPHFIIPDTASISSINIPEEMDVEEKTGGELVDLVVASGAGKYDGKMMAQVGMFHHKTRTSNCYISKQWLFYQGLLEGKDIYIDPEGLRRGKVINPFDDAEGIWIPVDSLNKILP